MLLADSYGATCQFESGSYAIKMLLACFHSSTTSRSHLTRTDGTGEGGNREKLLKEVGDILYTRWCLGGSRKSERSRGFTCLRPVKLSALPEIQLIDSGMDSFSCGYSRSTARVKW